MELGELEKVGLRDKWPNEAYDFTPWLAEGDNINLLGRALGLELEVENIEVPVGPYSADILAKDAGSDKYIVIENQLEKTNHDHLGKCITYSSVLDASSVVWIASEFTDEHKKALDWINDHTSDEINFYGVVLELWKIGDSKPAPRFNVVSRPANIVRQANITKNSENLSETRKLQLEFWVSFREKLKDSGKVPSLQSARPQYWFDIPLGRSHIHLSNIANTFDNKIGIRVYMGNKIADTALEQLTEYKEEIEKKIGTQLNWNPNPDNRDKIISLEYDADLRKKENWGEYLEWISKMSLKFREVFTPIVKKLDFDKPVSSDSD